MKFQKTKNIIRIVSAIIFSLSLTALTAENNFENLCKENIENYQMLNPHIAKECFVKLKDSNSVETLRKKYGDETTSNIISLNFAIHDLYMHILKNEKDKYKYVYSLIRILERKNNEECTICEIKAFNSTYSGITPENILWWVEKYHFQGTLLFKENTKELSGLSKDYINIITRCNIDEEKWKLLVISEKYYYSCKCFNSLTLEFIKEQEKLYKTTSGKQDLIKNLDANYKYLNFLKIQLEECNELNFESNALNKILELQNKFSSIFSKINTEIKEKEQKSKTKQEELKKLSKNLSSNENNLNQFFDGNNFQTKGDLKLNNKVSREQKNEESDKWNIIQEKLKNQILEEIKDTKAGKEIISFYNDPDYKKDGTNKLNFKIKNLNNESTFGYWSPIDKEIVINQKLVENFCKENKIKVDDLLKNEKYIKELAIYLSPTFVHEATHQKQSAWAQKNGVKIEYYDLSNGKYLTPIELAECKKKNTCGRIIERFPYQQEMETEAFAMDASYTAEKILKNKKYYEKIFCDFDKSNAKIFITQGVNGIRNENTYLHLDSFTGKTSKIMKKAQDIAKEINILREKKDKTPEEELKLKMLEEELEKHYNWFNITNKYIQQNNLKLQNWAKEINNKMLDKLDKEEEFDEIHY